MSLRRQQRLDERKNQYNTDPRTFSPRHTRALNSVIIFRFFAIFVRFEGAALVFGELVTPGKSDTPSPALENPALENPRTGTHSQENIVTLLKGRFIHCAEAQRFQTNM